MAVIVILAIVASYLLAENLMAPLRSIAAAVDRATAGDLSTPITVVGEDELARLAENHNRLSGDLARRNRELASILAAIGGSRRETVPRSSSHAPPMMRDPRSR